jgi:hypothetical protein
MRRWNETQRSASFWARVDKAGPVWNGTNCWLWLGAKQRAGHGRLRSGEGRKLILAHVFAYREIVGPIPDELELDHLCRNPACVNPSHLEPVTHQENLRRGSGWAGVHARVTHCPQGHPYDEANTRYNHRGYRWCKACDRARPRRVRHRVS